MIYIANAFSLSMLDVWRLEDSEIETQISIRPIANPAEWLFDAESRHGQAVSSVGHADTASVFAGILGREVAVNRVSVKIDGDTELLVGQYSGPRLPEGATTLPEGAVIRWLVVGVEQ